MGRTVKIRPGFDLWPLLSCWRVLSLSYNNKVKLGVLQEFEECCSWGLSGSLAASLPLWLRVVTRRGRRIQWGFTEDGAAKCGGVACSGVITAGKGGSPLLCERQPPDSITQHLATPRLHAETSQHPWKKGSPASNLRCRATVEEEISPTSWNVAAPCFA